MSLTKGTVFLVFLWLGKPVVSGELVDFAGRICKHGSQSSSIMSCHVSAGRIWRQNNSYTVSYQYHVYIWHYHVILPLQTKTFGYVCL